jgi:hypothetical protein
MSNTGFANTPRTIFDTLIKSIVPQLRFSGPIRRGGPELVLSSQASGDHLSSVAGWRNRPRTFSGTGRQRLVQECAGRIRFADGVERDDPKLHFN